MALPIVYKIPVKKTWPGLSTFLHIKDIAAILVAKGQGLIEVSIPSQRALVEAIKKSFINPGPQENSGCCHRYIADSFLYFRLFAIFDPGFSS
jgi:hypothetical protein